MHSSFRHLPSILWKGRPIHLTFFATRKCNAKCPWCFYLQSAGADTGAGEDLSLDEIREISRRLRRLLWVAFSGGEIFLLDDLVEMSAIFHDQNRPTVMLFPTNGLMPETIRDRTERILRRCPNSVIVVKVSVDGPDGALDARRGAPGGFRKAIETYRLVGELLDRHANLELGINTVFHSDNQDRMDEIIDLVAGLAPKGTHTISVIRGDLLDKRYKRIDVDKYRRATDRLARNLRNGTAGTHRFAGARLKAAQDILQRRLIHRTLVEDRRLVPCYSGSLSLVLTETGEVHPCETLATSLGNVRDHGYDMARLLRSERARAALEPIAAGACHCTHECNFIMNILFNPRLYPALLGEYLRLCGPGPGRVAAPPSAGETSSGPPKANTGSAGP